ncbi:MAG TPA: DUF169 domain-containing protein [Nitrospiraceae bacterium]|nr:DUF169 domain-containing protein [Nitrospiraceae bacterium]
MSVATHGRELETLLELRVPPVAIAFRDAPPAGMKRIESPAPAGCGYWRLAMEGEVFYTEAMDHYTCPVGAHTHGVELPPDVAQELHGLVRTMVQMQYIKMEEIPHIPRRQDPFRFALYASLADAPFEPDLVLIRGTAKQLMLVAEAAQAAGIASGGATMGRPTCAILPESLQSGQATASFGCIGNRVYTELADDEGYYAIPGGKVGEVISKLTPIVEANRQLKAFHQTRAARSST